jgi:hypothetical protein
MGDDLHFLDQYMTDGLLLIYIKLEITTKVDPTDILIYLVKFFEIPATVLQHV